MKDKMTLEVRFNEKNFRGENMMKGLNLKF